MMARFVLLLMLAGALAGPVAAQDRAETLADIRQQLSALGAELQGLRGELVAGAGAGAPEVFSLEGGAVLGAGSALARMDAIEQELQRLTARTEELQFRIDRIVTDGTNRLGDLEFRVVELEGGDLSAVATPPPLGGDAGTAAPVAESGGAELAIGEQADFDRAMAALDSGSFRSAADLFAAFTKTYTGGPLTAEAHFRGGLAQAGLGETTEAAKAYLEAFSAAPDGRVAPDALVELGISLGKLGQKPEACVTLSEAGMRFAGSPAAARATDQMLTLGCN